MLKEKKSQIGLNKLVTGSYDAVTRSKNATRRPHVTALWRSCLELEAINEQTNQPVNWVNTITLTESNKYMLQLRMLKINKQMNI